MAQAYIFKEPLEINIYFAKRALLVGSFSFTYIQRTSFLFGTCPHFEKEDYKRQLKMTFFIFRPVVRTTANAAIKGRAANLTVSHFIRDREFVERELFMALKRRLEGMTNN